MKLIMENWRKHLDEIEFNLSMGDTSPTDKGINRVFDKMLRGKYYDAYVILSRDGEGFLDKPIKNLLKKYSNFAIKFKKIDGRFVPPDVWLNDIKKGEKSFYRQWNRNN